MRTTEPDKTWVIALLLDMVYAHMSQGRSIEELAQYLERVVARRQRKDAGQ